MSPLAPTRRLLAARTAFQEFGRMPKKRDPDYIKSATAIHSYRDMFSGYLFPMSTFNFMKPQQLRQGEPNLLHWYTAKGMSKREERKSKFKEWYKEALGSVQYMDGYEYPELQDIEDLMGGEMEGVEPVVVVGSGKARAFAERVKELSENPNRSKADLETLIAQYVTWSDPSVARYEPASADDALRSQPISVYETLLLLCAEAQDWINAMALIREMGHRSIPLRSATAAALFDFVATPQMAMNLFEAFKKEGVKMHLHTYQAALRVFDRAEEEERCLTLKTQWEEGGDVTGDMIDFVLDGSADSLFPESSAYLSNIAGLDPRAEVEQTISTLLKTDRDRVAA